MKSKSVAALVALALAWVAFERQNVNANPDAICGASMRVTDSAKTTTAVINYTNDKHNTGTRTLCYDPSPLSPTHNCITHNASGNSGSFSISGLNAKTTYDYQITASDGGKHSDYSVCGSFTTISAVVKLNIPMTDKSNPKSVNKEEAYDFRGRALPPGLRPGPAEIIRSVP